MSIDAVIVFVGLPLLLFLGLLTGVVRHHLNWHKARGDSDIEGWEL